MIHPLERLGIAPTSSQPGQIMGQIIITCGTMSIVLDEIQEADMLALAREQLLDELTVRIKRLVRAARRRGERI